MDGSARMIIIGGDRVGSPRAVAVDPVERYNFLRSAVVCLYHKQHIESPGPCLCIHAFTETHHLTACSSWEDSQRSSRQTWSLGQHMFPTIFLQAWQSRASALASPFISFLTTSNQVFLGLRPKLHTHALPFPILFLSSPPDQTPSNCFSSEPIACRLIPQFCTTTHHLLPTMNNNFTWCSGIRRLLLLLLSPNHSNLCPLQHWFMPLLLWPCLTFMHHALPCSFGHSSHRIYPSVWATLSKVKMGDNSLNFFHAHLALETTAESAPSSAFSIWPKCLCIHHWDILHIVFQSLFKTISMNSKIRFEN